MGKLNEQQIQAARDAIEALIVSGNARSLAVIEAIAPHVQYQLDPGADVMQAAVEAANEVARANDHNLCIFTAEAIAAAASVLLAWALRDVTEDEQSSVARKNAGCTLSTWGRDRINEILQDRRTALEPKPKTPEERVIVVPSVKNEGLAHVELDGRVCGPVLMTQEDARIYRLGLIEKLKQEAHND